MFTTNYSEILRLIESVDPIEYGKTRNYLNGAVTRLSPYISRGVISTRQVATHVLSAGFAPREIETFLKELVWRDYFQQVWIALQADINKDIKQAQVPVNNHKISTAILESDTGINAIDDAIYRLYQTGYMHNHMRMYTASLCCNMAQSHWYNPARWMYYYLLDADWGSNALSWQWVAGSFSSKKYYANQENINTYCNTGQVNTFLDVSYEKIAHCAIPEPLKKLSDPFFVTNLPAKRAIRINESLPTCIYNFYNLDPNWMKDEPSNRILLLEPEFFKQYPVCDQTITFMLDLSKNIDGIQVFVGSFDELMEVIISTKVHYKEHPTNKHYKGQEHSRDWMFDQVKGYHLSFFSYWKKCSKLLEINAVHWETQKGI